jgi:MFS family permease
MWSRWFVLSLLVTTMLAMVQNMYRPMVSYRALELGATNPQIGYLLAAYGVTSLIVAAPAGQWVDRIGELPFIIGSAAVMAVGLGVLVRAQTLIAVGATQALIGMSHVVILLALQTFIANRSGMLDRDARFGMFALVTSIGQVIGPIVAGFLATASSTTTVFAWSAGATLGIVATASLLRGTPDTAGTNRRVDRRGSSLSATRMLEVLRIPSMPQAMVASLTVLAAIDLITAYLPVYAESRGISVTTVGILLGIRGAAGGLSRIMLVALLKRWSRKSILISSLGLPGIVVILLPLFSGVVPLAIILSVAGFGLGLGQPMSLAWVTSVAPPTSRGTAIGLRLTGNRAGQTVIPAAVGLISATGVGAVFVATAVLLLAGAAVMFTAELAEPHHETSGSG